MQARGWIDLLVSKLTFVSANRAAAVGAAVAALGFGGAAQAGFTPISMPPGYESTQTGIFSHQYGGTFSLEGNGVDYTNGTLTAVRVSDFLPSSSTSDNPGPVADDQLWQGSIADASAQAVFATVSTSPFGYITGSSGGTFQSLFPVKGSGFNVSGNGIFLPGVAPFRFAAENPFGLISSLPSDNVDSKDHIVTYEINGLTDGFKTWLLFFDDYGNAGNNGDFDYQDLVVQVKTLPLASSSVPEPGSLMLIGGIGTALLTRVRRRKA